MKRKLLVLLCCLLAQMAAAQEPYLKHYTVNDGLPASNVYKAIMDRQGFIWLCTANGVSRFNGYEFRNYNLTNGFPGHGAFTGTVDSSGRVWFLTFNDRACFYDGQAFHAFPTPYPVSWVIADMNDDVFFLTTVGHVLQYRSGRLFHDIKIGSDKLYHACIAAPGKLILQAGNRCIAIKDGQVRTVPTQVVYSDNMKFLRLRNGQVIGSGPGGTYEYRNDSLVLWYRRGPGDQMDNQLTDICDDGQRYWFCAQNGLFCCADSFDPRRAVPVLKKFPVSAFCDKDGNLWLATFHEGLYLVRPPGPRSFYFPNDNAHSLVGLAGATRDGDVLLFYEGGMVRSLRREGNRFRIRGLTDVGGTLYHACRDGSGGLIARTIGAGTSVLRDGRSVLVPDYQCYFNEAQHRLYLLEEHTWSLWVRTMKGDSLLAGPMPDALRAQYRRRYPNLVVRAWAMQNDTVWFGNEDGLFRYTPGRIDRPFAQPAAQAYTSGITIARDGTLWVATRGMGAYAIRNGALRRYGVEQGVAALNCNSIYIDETDAAWIASQEGLYRVDRQGRVKSFNHRSLLPSFEVSSVYRSGNTVYVAGASGLSAFNESGVEDSLPVPEVLVAGIVVNGRKRVPGAALRLMHDENHIRIDFTAIDYSSVREPSFYYCLSGKDSIWLSAAQPYVDFSFLPPGAYTFYVAAANGDGRRSRPVSVHFVIRPPFWNTWWFYTLMTIAVLCVLLLVLRYYRLRSIRERRFAENEIKALRLHMNPHFIFNTLNSLQVFIFSNRPLEANHYIAKFSRLIRWVMQYSDRQELTLQEELEFLQNYIDLERLRFHKNFTLRLDVDPEIDTNTTIIPALVVQPFVENAIRHGLSGKEGDCILEISLKRRGRFLYVTISDNGVGRDKVKEEQALSPRQNNSTGIRYTRERLRLLSRRGAPEEQVQITDLFEEGRPSGTRIQLIIPIAYESYQRNHHRR